MADKSPAFQWYAKDFLADANVMAMNMTERGIYITLISVCWIEGTIPADVSRLARICAMTFDDFLPCWLAIEPTFNQKADDPLQLVHPRLEKEMKKQKQWRTKSKQGGVQSGLTRRQAAKANADKNNAVKGGLDMVEPAVEVAPVMNKP